MTCIDVCNLSFNTNVDFGLYLLTMFMKENPGVTEKIL